MFELIEKSFDLQHRMETDRIDPREYRSLYTTMRATVIKKMQSGRLNQRQIGNLVSYLNELAESYDTYLLKEK